MKKIVLFNIILVLAFSLFAVEHVEDKYNHYMVGHVDTATDFSATIMNEVLPFDLESADVAYNANYSTAIRGLRVGYYSLISNTSGFELLISHTPLVLSSTPSADDEGTLSSIDYRLYAVADYQNTKFLTCLSDANASNPVSATNKIRVASDNENVWPSGATMCSIVNQSLYVSLDDSTSGSTPQTVAALKAGTYQSTIYFLLRGR